MIFKLAEIKDIERILPLVKNYISESDWDVDFNLDNSIEMLSRYIFDCESDVVFVEVDSVVSAFALIAHDYEFHSHKIGYIPIFYVDKDSRGTKVARFMIDNCNAWFDDADCKHVFASSSANIPSEGKQFENLLGKYGYKQSGAVLARVK